MTEIVKAAANEVSTPSKNRPGKPFVSLLKRTLTKLNSVVVTAVYLLIVKMNANDNTQINKNGDVITFDLLVQKVSKLINKIMYKTLLTTAILLFSGMFSFGQSDWKLSVEKDGIKVYTSKVPESKIKAIKVECELDATESQLVALLLDVNSSAKWIYHTKSATLVKQISPSELYYYSEINLPWPAANRDFVAHLTVNQNPITKVVRIDGPAIDGMVPEKKGVVRVTDSQGLWTITPCGYNRIKVAYSLHTDPAGNLPAWMVNMFATEGPMQVFENMRVQLQKPAYKTASLPFIDEKQYATN
jgi:hypothetical protein